MESNQNPENTKQQGDPIGKKTDAVEPTAKVFGEEDVGIEEFIMAADQNMQIKCTVKHRYSDFIVNEIDEKGKVIWFKSEQSDLEKWRGVNIKQTLPQSVLAQVEEVEAQDKANDADLVVPTKEIAAKLKGVLEAADAKSFLKFTEEIENETTEKSTILQFQGDFGSKEKRSQVHQFFKKHLKKYETDTLSIGDQRSMRVYLKEGVSKNKRQKQGITNWGDRGMSGIKMPDFLQFVVQKTNYESMQAVHYISKRINKKPKYFAICGNKDKRGITTQRVSLSRGNAEALIRAQCGKDWDRKVKCGSFERVYTGLHLGQLSGNRFSVALRFIDRNTSDADITKNIKNVEEHGFVNYFGMQRFGTFTVRTHQMGKEILRQNWREVVRLILVQHADFEHGDKERKQKMTELVFGEHADGAVHERLQEAMYLLDRRDRLEKTVLISLKNQPNDYYNAFAAISRNTRFIYIHAYQSYVWNKAVSERLRRHGRNVLVGDFVVPDCPDVDQPVEQDDIGESDEEEGKKEEQKVEEAKTDDAEQNVIHIGAKKIKYVEVTEENKHEYTLYDVIFPLIGHSVKLPKNKEMRELIEGILKDDGMAMNLFADQEKMATTSAAGSYRRIAARATDIIHDIVEIQNTNEDLLSPNYMTEPDPTPTTDEPGDEDGEDNRGATSKALRIKFSLRASSYATMFLREVTRTSSAFSTQQLLSSAANKSR